jgi:hypothetical protein
MCLHERQIIAVSTATASSIFSVIACLFRRSRVCGVCRPRHTGPSRQEATMRMGMATKGSTAVRKRPRRKQAPRPV